MTRIVWLEYRHGFACTVSPTKQEDVFVAKIEGWELLATTARNSIDECVGWIDSEVVVLASVVEEALRLRGHDA